MSWKSEFPNVLIKVSLTIEDPFWWWKKCSYICSMWYFFCIWMIEYILSLTKYLSFILMLWYLFWSQLWLTSTDSSLLICTRFLKTTLFTATFTRQQNNCSHILKSIEGSASSFQETNTCLTWWIKCLEETISFFTFFTF